MRKSSQIEATTARLGPAKLENKKPNKKMKIKHNKIELNVSDDAFATGGSFPADGGTYSGNWYEANATDNDGNEYRVIWTDVDWDAEDGADACDWKSPNYILQS